MLKKCLALLLLTQHVTSFALDVTTLNVDTLHTALTQKKVTCEQVAQAHLDHIFNYNLANNDKPPLNAITVLTPNLLAQAHALDVYYQRNETLSGPLHCVPIFLKDNIDSYDSPSTSGSLALLGSQPIQDAFLVKQLRDAGALIMGKASMDELAFGMFGMSGRNGRTGNAYDTTQNPGGSSAGSGVVVAAGFSVLAVGSDNSGSVRIPAAFNGIYGLRPSRGMVSREGIFPRGNLDGVAGPMARHPYELAIMMDAIAQSDPKDPITLKAKRPDSFVRMLTRDSLKGKRIGVLTQVGKVNVIRNLSSDMQTHTQATLKAFEALGATVVTEIAIPDFNSQRNNNMAGEVEDVDAYLNRFPSTRQSYKDICESGRVAAFESVKACLKHIRTTPSKKMKATREVLKMFKANRRAVQQVMDAHNLDALLLPINTTGPATYTPDNINTFTAALASNAGLPAISFPIGYVGTPPMPLALQLVGRRYSDADLIAMVYAYAMAYPMFTPPKLVGSTDSHSPRTVSTRADTNASTLIASVGSPPPAVIASVGSPPPAVIASARRARGNPATWYDIPTYNNFITELGDAASKDYLQYDNAMDLSPDAFLKLYKTVLDNVG